MLSNGILVSVETIEIRLVLTDMGSFATAFARSRLVALWTSVEPRWNGLAQIRLGDREPHLDSERTAPLTSFA